MRYKTDSVQKLPLSNYFGYTAPNKDRNHELYMEYIDYVKHIDVAEYEAKLIGNYIKKSSTMQLAYLNNINNSLGHGFNIINNKLDVLDNTIRKGFQAITNELEEINYCLRNVNRKMDLLIEQQKINKLLLENINELLRIPESEKERQKSILLGLKFFVNAQKDKDLYDDALNELLKAESFMHQDYFVLHRIGCVYMYVEKHLNPEKALDYFTRAAKYASVESDPNAIRLVNVLATNSNTIIFNNYSQQKDYNEDPESYKLTNKNGFFDSSRDLEDYDYDEGLSHDKKLQIAANSFAADSYEKAAFSAYVLCNFENAVNYQSKAIKYNPAPQNKFILSKYLIRNNQLDKAIITLNEAIDEMPILASAVFKEVDLFDEPKVLELLNEKNEDVENKIDLLIEEWKKINKRDIKNVRVLINVKKGKFENKHKLYNESLRAINDFKRRTELNIMIDIYINRFKNEEFTFNTINENKLIKIINDLESAKILNYEKLKEQYESIKKRISEDVLVIGSKYMGGSIFKIDYEKKYALIFVKLLNKSIWGINNFVSATDQDNGVDNTRAIITKGSTEIKKGWIFDEKIHLDTAAILCANYSNKYCTDWYLPSINEIRIIYNSYKEGLIKHKFENKSYWSSTEEDKDYAYEFNFITGLGQKRKKNQKNQILSVCRVDINIIKLKNLPIQAFTVMPENSDKRKKERNKTKEEIDTTSRIKTHSPTTSYLTIKNPETGKIIEIYDNDFDTKLSWEEAYTKCKELGEGWRVPSLIEFDEIYEELHAKGKGNFKSMYYWSDEEDEEDEEAWAFNFKNGFSGIDEGQSSKKNNKYYVRAVRDVN